MRLFASRFCRAALIAALLLLSLAVGPIPLWPQGSELNSNGSRTSMSVWDSLYGSFQSEMTALQASLQRALHEAETSRLSERQWIDLYESSSRRIASLKNGFEQIGQRMQGKDEEIFWLYQEIDGLEKTILGKNNTILRLWLAVAALSLIILCAVFVAVAKGYMKLKMPFRW